MSLEGGIGGLAAGDGVPDVPSWITSDENRRIYAESKKSLEFMKSIKV
jgi:hypothetical protein